MLNEGDRAIVIGMGQRGARVVSAARQRWATRRATGQRLAWLEATTLGQALQGIPEAVTAITRLLPDALFNPPQGGGSRPSSVRVLVVAALDEDVVVELLVLARGVRRAVEGVADVRLVGLAILPDHHPDALPPQLSTRERLRDWLGPGAQAQPVWDGGFLCLGSANQSGFTLAPVERDALGAEMVVQWLAGPLDQASGPAASPAPALMSAGVAAWVYPLARLQVWTAQRRAAALLAAWLTSTVSGNLAPAESAADLVTQLGLSRPSLGEEAIPSAIRRDLYFPTDNLGLILGGLWSPPRNVAAAYHTWLDTLTQQRGLLDKVVSDLTTRLAGAIVTAMLVALDEPSPGRPRDVLLRLAALRETLSQLAEEARASAERHCEAVSHLDTEREEIERQIGVLADHLPPSLLTALGWLVRPWRLWAAFQAARALRAQSGALAALLQRSLALMVELVRDDQCQAVYHAVAERVARLEADVQRLTDRLDEARGQVELSETGLYGVLDFPTECSLLTPELVAALTESLCGDTGFMLREAAAQGLRLSAWLAAPPDAATLAARCLAYGQQHDATLAKLTADELFGRRFPTPPERWEALRGLMAAAAPFLRWDEAQASRFDLPQVAVSRWLALAQGESAALFGEAASRLGQTRAMPTEDPTRITAVQMVQGVALDTLILDEEVKDELQTDISVAVV